MPARRTAAPIALAALLAVLAAPWCAASDALPRALHELHLEAARARRARALDLEVPDFAGRFDRAAEIDPASLAEVVLTRADRDPFVDAYVRWQLLSFDPPWPDLDDRGFERLLAELPPLVENPRADPDVLAVLRRVDEAGALPERDVPRLERLEADLALREAAARTLNRPALGLRDWVARRAGEDGPRPHLLRLERCAAAIAGGWSTRAAKSAMTRGLQALHEPGPALTADDRAWIASRIERLAGARRSFAGEIVIYANRTVHVTFSTAAVSRRDADRWLERLAAAPRPPPGDDP